MEIYNFAIYFNVVPSNVVIVGIVIGVNVKGWPSVDVKTCPGLTAAMALDPSPDMAMVCQARCWSVTELAIVQFAPVLMDV
jgi:hypothetical protein